MGFNFQVGARPVFAGVPGLAPTTPPRPVAAIRRGERLPSRATEEKREQAPKPVRTPVDVETRILESLEELRIQREALQKESLAALDAISRAREVVIRERKALDRKRAGMTRSVGTISLADLQKVVATIVGEPALALTSSRRDEKAIAARMVLYWLARRFTGRSLPIIAAAYKRKDHTTALYGIRRVDLLVETLEAPAEDTPEAWARLLLAQPKASWPHPTFKYEKR